MRTRIILLLGFVLLLAACGLARTPAANPSAQAPLTEATPTPPEAASADQAGISPQPTYRFTLAFPDDVVTPLPTRVRPTVTPDLTCDFPRPDLDNPWIDVDVQSFTPVGEIAEEQHFQDYTVRIYDEYLACCCASSLQVLKGDKRIYAARALAHLWIGRSIKDQPNDFEPILAGQDVTGDGLPDLVITHYTGGAHCCTYYRVFELSTEVRLLGTIYAGDYDSWIQDLDSDSNYEFVVPDWAYQDYGPWAQAGKPGPYVLLHYQEGAYHLAKELMHKPALSDTELQALATPYITGGQEPSYDGRFWEDIVGLIYSGNPEQTEPFLALVWPDEPERQQSFLHSLLRIMQDSLYWPEIKELSDKWPWPEMALTPAPLPTATPLPTVQLSPSSLCDLYRAADELPDPGPELCTSPHPDKPEDEQSFGAYTVRVYKDPSCLKEFLQVLQGDQCVYAQLSDGFQIGGYRKTGPFAPIPVGEDITGDGSPDLVVAEWSGGNLCCDIFFVFSLEPQFQAIGRLVTNIGSESHFVDLDGDRNWEFVTSDWTFAWSRGPAQFYPELQFPVILRFTEGAYHLAADLMRQLAPSQEELTAQAQQIRDLEWGSWQQGIALASILRRLVYSGHAEMVGPFLDTVWPDSDPGEAEYLEWFARSFAESPYWPEIKDLSAEWPWPDQ